MLRRFLDQIAGTTKGWDQGLFLEHSQVLLRTDTHLSFTSILARQKLAQPLKSVVPVSSVPSAAAAAALFHISSVGCLCLTGGLGLLKTDLPEEIT